MSKRLRQMDKNLIDKLQADAVDYIHFARTIPVMELLPSALIVIENRALDMVATIRNYRMKHQSPIFTEGQKA